MTIDSGMSVVKRFKGETPGICCFMKGKKPVFLEREGIKTDLNADGEQEEQIGQF